MNRTGIAIAAALMGFLAPPSAAQEGPPLAVPEETQAAVDLSGRVVTDVALNDVEGFRFILDTGANASVIGPHVAQTLGLTLDPARSATVTGVTGVEIRPTVQLRRLQSGALDLRDVTVAVVERAALGDADGILGADGLGDMRVEIQMKRARYRIVRAAQRFRGLDYVRVPARILSQRLFALEGRIDGVRAFVVIDTGAEHSLSNRALVRALRARRVRSGADRSAEVIGVTRGTVRAEILLGPELRVGPVIVRNTSSYVGDFPIFKVWGLEDQPTLILGMDVLRGVDSFVLDYRRGEFHVRTQQPLFCTGTRLDCR